MTSNLFISSTSPPPLTPYQYGNSVEFSWSQGVYYQRPMMLYSSSPPQHNSSSASIVAPPLHSSSPRKQKYSLLDSSTTSKATTTGNNKYKNVTSSVANILTSPNLKHSLGTNLCDWYSNISYKATEANLKNSSPMQNFCSIDGSVFSDSKSTGFFFF